MPERKKRLYSTANLTLIILLGIALIAGSLFMAKYIRLDIQSSHFETLRLVSTESAKAVAESLQSRISFLETLWIQLKDATPTERADLLMQHQERSDIYGFDWLGCTDASGVGIKSTGQAVSLDNGSVFQSNMNGQIGIGLRPVTLPDGSKMDGIILSIPLYADGSTPSGCLYQSFSPDKFYSVLEVGAFDGHASITLLEANGNILAASETSVLTTGENILETLENEEDNQAYASALARVLKSPQSGGGLFHLQGEGWYSYYTPITLTIEDATLTIGSLSVVSESFIAENIRQSFQRVVQLTLLIICAVVLLGVLIFRFYTRNKEELEQLAYQDILTGQANYEAFKRDFAHQRSHGGVLILCDIVQFKLINRYFGETKGDEVLRQLGALFAREAEAGRLAARISDDQFILFYPNMAVTEAPQKCQALEAAIQETMQQLGLSKQIPAFGYCAVKDNEPVEALRSKVMFAKALGKINGNYCCAYDEQAAVEYTENLRLMDELDEALKTGSFEVWYQPKYEVRYQGVGGAEALIRWRGKDGRLISPGRFIPLLEQQGKIDQVDEFVFTQVCRYQRQRLDKGLFCIPISVNISRVSLLNADIVQRYQAILTEAGIDQNDIYLEITEDSVDNNIVEVLRDLHNAGFHLLMDDFGKGSSNLAYLRPDLFSGIKFDKSLIDLVGSKEESTVLRHTLWMVRDMGMSITAEGVEKQEQVEFLGSQRCDEIQGYFYYRPMDEAAFTELLEGNDVLVGY